MSLASAGGLKIFGVILGEALQAWNHHKKTELLKELDQLMEAYDGEMQKPSFSERHLHPERRVRDFRDNSVLDDTERRLLNIGKVYLSTRGTGSNVRDSSES